MKGITLPALGLAMALGGLLAVQGSAWAEQCAAACGCRSGPA